MVLLVAGRFGAGLSLPSTLKVAHIGTLPSLGTLLDIRHEGSTQQITQGKIQTRQKEVGLNSTHNVWNALLLQRHVDHLMAAIEVSQRHK